MTGPEGRYGVPEVLPLLVTDATNRAVRLGVAPVQDESGYRVRIALTIHTGETDQVVVLDPADVRRVVQVLRHWLAGRLHAHAYRLPVDEGGR